MPRARSCSSTISIRPSLHRSGDSGRCLSACREQPVPIQSAATAAQAATPHIRLFSADGNARRNRYDGLMVIRPRHAALAAAVVAAMATTLALMGHPLICKCGYVKLWHGVPLSSENSQHISDWYTFSHVIHGFAFYGLAWLAARRQPIGVRLIAAVALECGW